MPVSEKISKVTVSLYRKKGGVKKVEEKKGQKLNVKSVSKGFVTELKGVFCTNSIRVGVLFIFLTFFEFSIVLVLKL